MYFFKFVSDMKILLLLTLCGLALGQRQRTPLYGNPDELVYPGPVNTKSVHQPSSREISLKLARKINSIQSIEEFLDVFGVPPEQKSLIIASRFGDGERSNTTPLISAICEPELQPVPFPIENTDPLILYHPMCTRIKRCGGCCNHSLLSCQPTASITNNYKVQVLRLKPDGNYLLVRNEIFSLEEHTHCKCECTTKPEHCVGKQIYDKNECICKCPNPEEEEKCERPNGEKLWDPEKCDCRCRNNTDCNSGFYPDPIHCRCERLAVSRWFSYENTTGYILREQTNTRNVPLLLPIETDRNSRRKNKDDPEYN